MRAVSIAIVGALLVTCGSRRSAFEGLPKGGEPYAHCTDRVERDLAYGPSSEQRIDLFVPRAAAPAPVVVWLHPGGWAGGDRKDVRRWALRQVCRGYAVATLGYRLSERATFPAQIEDVHAALRDLHDRAGTLGIDGARIVVWGASAGGHLAALAGARSTPPAWGTEPPLRGVITWWAPVDFTTMDAELAHHDCPHADCHTCPGSPESRLLGRTVRDDPEAARRASPLAYLRATDPPFLVMHGSADCTVPVEQSNELADRLEALGVSVEHVVVDGAMHGDHRWSSRRASDAVDRFLDARLAP